MLGCRSRTRPNAWSPSAFGSFLVVSRSSETTRSPCPRCASSIVAAPAVPGRQRLVDDDDPDEAVRRLLRHRRHADALEEQEARLDERRLVALVQAEASADDVHVSPARAPERSHDPAAGVGALRPARSADACVR